MTRLNESMPGSGVEDHDPETTHFLQLTEEERGVYLARANYSDPEYLSYEGQPRRFIPRLSLRTTEDPTDI